MEVLHPGLPSTREVGLTAQQLKNLAFVINQATAAALAATTKTTATTINTSTKTAAISENRQASVPPRSGDHPSDGPCNCHSGTHTSIPHLLPLHHTRAHASDPGPPPFLQLRHAHVGASHTKGSTGARAHDARTSVSARAMAMAGASRAKDSASARADAHASVGALQSLRH